MKDLTDYFTTPRKTAPIDSQDTDVKSVDLKHNNHQNGSCKKLCEKRKLEPVLDSDLKDDQAKSKRNSIKFSKITPNFGENLTVVLTQIDVDLPKNRTPETKDIRVFKNVLLEDCSKGKGDKHPDELNDPKTKPKLTKKYKSKRKRVHVVESDSSDAEKSDSSAKVFKEEAKQAKVAGTLSGRRLDGNNLFSYFSKAEKKPVQSVEDNNSPIKCRRVVEVEALIHSPPKARRNLLSECDCEMNVSKMDHPNIDDVRLPVVKIVRADYAKFRALDEIVEIGTDFVDTTTTQKQKTETASSDEGESSSDNFTPSKIQPWKMRVQFVSGAKLYNRRKNVESRGKMSGKVEEEKAEEVPRDEFEKKLVVSLPRAVPVTHEKVLMEMTTCSPISAGAVEDKPVIKKLAPLFCRPVVSKKIPPQPVDTEARRLFLESGVPESIKKKMEEQKNPTEESVHREYYFPKQTHVQQIEPANWVWKLENVTSFVSKPSDESIVIPKFENIISFVSYKKPAGGSSSLQKFDVYEEIAVMKKQEPGVNVADVFASIKKLSLVAGSKNDSLSWTEKYKPSTFSDVIGNSTSLSKLKEWIESHKRTKIRLSESDDGSSEEFVDSDDSSCSVDSRNNVALLVGPPGCGKTCSVYTLANELGFKVLEVNAASNRSGKRILDELQEATQSHRVKRTTIFDKDMKKLKKKKKETNHEKKTMSLILVEDVDILFQNFDEGFLSALSSLTLHSKRPFIFTVNNLNCPQLLKYTKAQNLILTFAYPTWSLLNVWLRSIALNEGVKLSDEVLMYLFHVAGLDLRKSLLQLQMLISSSKCHFTLTKEQLFYNNWSKQIVKTGNRKSAFKFTTEPRTYKNLFSDEDDDSEPTTEPSHDHCQETLIRAKSKNEKDADAKVLKQLTSFFERIALLGRFERTNSNHSMVFPNDETASDQFTDSVYHSQLNNDILGTLKNFIFTDDCVTDSSFVFKEYYEKIRIHKDIEHLVENVFNHFNPVPTSTVSKYCDYLPAIRNIARIESNKASGQRRANRYFSYLNSINVHVSDRDTNVLSHSLL